MKVVRPKGWFFNHIISIFYLNFRYEQRYFWWGKDNPWDDYQPVRFRYIKFFCAHFLAIVSKSLMLLVVLFLRSIFGGSGLIFAFKYSFLLFCLAALFALWAAIGDL